MVESIYSQLNPKIGVSGINLPNQNVASKVNIPQTQDSYIPSEQKENKINKWKLFGGIAVGLGIALAGAGLIHRCKFQQIKQLAEHINFKPAKTIEEAKQFALENFKIKSFDVGDDVEIANWVNEGLTQVSNRYKGKAFLPSRVALLPNGEAHLSTVASMSQAIKSPQMSNTLYINNKHFERDNIEKEIRILKDLFRKKRGRSFDDYYFPFLKQDRKLLDILLTARKNGENIDISRFEAAKIIDDFILTANYGKLLSNQPMYVLRDLYSQKGFVDIARKNAPKVFKELSELEKMDASKLEKYTYDLWKQLASKMNFEDIPTSSICPADTSIFRTIFHELGHTNHERKAMFDFNKMRVGHEETNPEIGKLAKEFVESKEEQFIASTVSIYAKHSPLEFVAEVYSKMMNGTVFGEDVMKLYNKYKGPIIPA